MTEEDGSGQKLMETKLSCAAGGTAVMFGHVGSRNRDKQKLCENLRNVVLGFTISQPSECIIYSTTYHILYAVTL